MVRSLSDAQVISEANKPAVRDFIPEGEEMTPQERARRISNVPGLVTQDFIPAPGEAPNPAIPRDQREAARAKAHQDAADAHERRKTSLRKSLDETVAEAKTKLKGRGVQDTVMLIEKLNMADREAYLLAEEEGANRKTVLQSFSPVRKVARERLSLDRSAAEAPTSPDA